MELPKGRKSWLLILWTATVYWINWLLRQLRLRRRRPGLAVFLQQYEGDGARVVDPREREHAPARGLCVLCGLCDAIAAEHGASSSPLDLAVALSRPTAGVPDRGAQSLGDTEIARAIAARCPMGVRL